MHRLAAHLKQLDGDVEVSAPASERILHLLETDVGPLPNALGQLLQSTNGLVCRSFKVYCAFDPDAPTKTWDSIQRANDPAKTDALRSDTELLRRFLVFADIGDGFAVIDRKDDTIWFEDTETNDLSQLNLSLHGFLETMIAEAV